MPSRSRPPASSPGRTASPGGRVLFVIALVLTGLVGVALGAFVGLPGMVERGARAALVRLESRLGVEVSAARVDWSWGGVVEIEGLVVTHGGAPLAEAARASLELDVAVWDRRVRAVALHLERPTLHVRRGADGGLELLAILARLRDGQGGGRAPGGVTIEPALPTIAMEHATVDVDLRGPAGSAPMWGRLPIDLAIPERMALRDGTVTVLAEAGREEAWRIEARFADTTIDPGYGLRLGATLSRAAGAERLEADVARPIRFYLGDRVVGVGGVAWSPAREPAGDAPSSFELVKLQLSVPVSRAQGGVVPAALTAERVTVTPEPLTLLARAGGAGASLERIIQALDGVVVERPVLALEVDAHGRHSFGDLLRGGHEDALEAPRRARGAGEESLSRATIGASLSASDRILAASGAARGDALSARLARKFEALVRASERLVPRAAQALDRLVTRRLEVRDGEVITDLAGARFDLRGVDLAATVEGGAKRLAARFDLIDAGAPPAPDPGAGTIVGRHDRVSIDARLGADRRLAIELDAEGLPIAWLPAEVLEAAHFLPEGTITSAALTFTGAITGRAWDLEGDVAIEDAVFTHPSVARDPLRDLDLGWKGRVSLDADAGRLTLAEARLRSKQVGVVLDVDVDDARRVPRFRIRAELPEAPLQSLVDAIPLGMRPMLDGLRVDGSLRWSLAVDLDSARPGEVVVKSEPTLTGFGVVSFGTRLDFGDLRGAQSYRIRLGDGTPGTRLVGPMTGSWVPLERVSPYLPAALTTTEDGSFYSNDGISTFALRESLALNLERGSFVRGASTITQQLVKNLYLGGDKTLARKLQELFIAWQMTKALSKGEIMALYLNTIEFGPGIYGIGDAAWYYFGKRPFDLDLTEAIFLTSIVPGPRRYHYFFEEGRVTARWRAYLESLLDIMVARNKITAEEKAAAAPFEPRFRGAELRDAPPEDPLDEGRPPDWDLPPDDHEDEPDEE
ncbi:MAG: transglycosylase domain-containing protein [Deltaproteobacteria bacterium]|nr:transglycosylase domain-containing protein [Deltaproteobacteria bacterium]